MAWFATQSVRGQWAGVAEITRGRHVDWPALAGSTLVVLGAYAILVQLWRGMLGSIGFPIPYAEAFRVWSVANLGRYIPGKVWALGAMSVLLRGYGVPPVTSTTIALLNVLINTVAGLVVALAAVATVSSPPLSLVVAIGVGGFGLAIARPLLPVVVSAYERITGRVVGHVLIPARAMWVTAMGGAVTWGMYGVAFRGFVWAVLGSAPGSTSAYVGAFVFSYLVGFVALFAPGGIVVREVALTQMMATLGLATPAEAAVIAVASRLWLSAVELGPGLVWLAWRTPSGARRDGGSGA